MRKLADELEAEKSKLVNKAKDQECVGVAGQNDWVYGGKVYPRCDNKPDGVSEVAWNHNAGGDW